MSFFGGLQELVLAGVDGYVTIETAKNQNVEAVPPAPAYTATEAPEGYRPTMMETLTANSGGIFLVSGLLLAAAVFLKGR